MAPKSPKKTQATKSPTKTKKAKDPNAPKVSSRVFFVVENARFDRDLAKKTLWDDAWVDVASPC
jgi:hypothetical protein